MFDVTTIPGKPLILFGHHRFRVGRVQLWLPEGFATARGMASVYPDGVEWRQDGSTYTQQAGAGSAFGPGNFEEVQPGVLECVGVRMLKERPVEWSTRCVFGEDRVDFSITARNPNDTSLQGLAAAVCIKFMDGDWWSDKTTFLLTPQGVRSVADLGRNAGMPNGFQAWLVEGESCNHPFYVDFWGFNDTRATKPVWASRCERENCTVTAACDSACFIHSNPGNPCTDLAMKFGDLEPGEEAVCTGYIELTTMDAGEVLENA